ncbi:MAG: hypothetical protein JWL93_1519 [Hyphomicrobiales bacterium]|nr:hypothetical protein [Hyphomicrobiales bacterium]
MSLKPSQIAQLKQIVEIAQKFIAQAEKRTKSRSQVSTNGGARRRRSGKELVAFKKLLKSERKRGVPVAELARQHGISSAYIYMIK